MKISVCMAAYNGTLYIREQIGSILCQLGPDDELVIVDDASQDETVQLILAFEDPRIILLRNERNLKPLRSFERALMHASGDLIFLSDQDDIWRADKVEIFKAFFAANPRVTLALSDARVIDKNGEEKAASWIAWKGRKAFKPGLLRNFAKNSYFGCTMVFRREVLKYSLPFPQGIPIHDSWIGLLNQIYGQAGFIDQPLIRHRRHGSNDSVETRAAWKKVILQRWRIGTSLLKRVLAIKLKSLRSILCP
jgi:glycosyltransferase involved in cell wall biosynthesis